MSLALYSLGRARRHVAGNIWTAQKRNKGKLPCLFCRGGGTVKKEEMKGAAIAKACPQCQATGFADPVHFKLWMKLWIYESVTGKRTHDEILHG